MGVEFKYTAPGTSQLNDHVEWKFATIFNGECVILNGGKFFAFLRNGLLAKASNTATLLENNLVTSSQD